MLVILEEAYQIHCCQCRIHRIYGLHTRWFKYDRDYLCVNKPVTVPVIFEPPCIRNNEKKKNRLGSVTKTKSEFNCGK